MYSFEYDEEKAKAFKLSLHFTVKGERNKIAFQDLLRKTSEDQIKEELYHPNYSEDLFMFKILVDKLDTFKIILNSPPFQDSNISNEKGEKTTRFALSEAAKNIVTSKSLEK